MQLRSVIKFISIGIAFCITLHVYYARMPVHARHANMSAYEHFSAGDKNDVHSTKLALGRNYTQNTSAFAVYDKPLRFARSNKRNVTSVYICALSKSQLDWQNVYQTPVMKYMVKSIYETHTQSSVSMDLYNITVLIGVDQDDQFWQNRTVELQTEAMKLYQISLIVHVYESQKNGSLPFNVLMQDAFEANAEYLVRVNDDTQFETIGWIPQAVKQLMAFKPVNVGVVGPVCHEGNTNIMTHDMVHRTHLQIFPTYYPSVFHNWYIDDWISAVYGEARTVQMKTWHVHHHIELGTRYTPVLDDENLLGKELDIGTDMINRYLQENTLDTKLKIRIQRITNLQTNVTGNLRKEAAHHTGNNVSIASPIVLTTASMGL